MPNPILNSVIGQSGSHRTIVTPPLRIVICDDSAVIRSVLTRVLGSDPGIEVVGRTTNGQEVVDFIRRQPGLADVLVLDIEMPVMDGLSALPLLLEAAPKLRIIIASTLTTRGASTTLEALRLGAHDYVPKPSTVCVAGDISFQRELLDKVRALGRRTASVASKPATLRPAMRCRPHLLAIGSSTGGPQALGLLLQGLSSQLGPSGLTIPAVLTQHMPPAFTSLLAEQLGRLGIPCAEAQDGAPLCAGRVHIAPGGRHLLVQRLPNGELITRLDDGPAENFCRPSVDPMLRSAVEACDGRVLMLMLTGMGSDGLAGTKAVIEAGGAALAQDEATSVVWGMPGAIARAGLCQAILPISDMAKHAIRLMQGA
ncbi:MAG: chemotaxis-specific protein-glutamate methyltransferase CheB [Janthinobacterium lividum]